MPLIPNTLHTQRFERAPKNKNIKNKIKGFFFAQAEGQLSPISSRHSIPSTGLDAVFVVILKVLFDVRVFVMGAGSPLVCRCVRPSGSGGTAGRTTTASACAWPEPCPSPRPPPGSASTASNRPQPCERGGGAGGREWWTATSLRGNVLNVPVVCVEKTNVICLHEVVRQHVSHQPQNNPGFTQVRGDYRWVSSGDMAAAWSSQYSWEEEDWRFFRDLRASAPPWPRPLARSRGGVGGEGSPFNQTDALQTWSWKSSLDFY